MFALGVPTIMTANSDSHHSARLQLDSREFNDFRDYLQKIAGIDLGHNKQYLVSTRIRRIMIDYQCETLGELTTKIKSPVNKELRQKVVDAMTTNETFWFRDLYPFEYFRNTLLPELTQNKTNNRIRIWSAACSSGQEPYSLSIVVEEFIRSQLGLSSLPLEIVATDLSSKVLENARNGEYDRLSIARGLSEQRLKTYFDQPDTDTWRVKNTVKQRISFKPLNLQESFVLLGRFDIVFCRNVLIYFSPELKKDILTRIHGAMKPGGYLFLGSSESLSGANDLFEMVHCNPGVVYRAI